MNTISTVTSKTDTDNQNKNKEKVIATNHRLKDIINLPNGIDKEEIQSYIDKEIHWLRSDEYIRRKMAATGKSEEKIRKDVEKILAQLPKTTLEFDKNTKSRENDGYFPDKKNPKMRISEEIIDKKRHKTDHEIKHALSERALETSDELLELFNNKYKNYPRKNVFRWYDIINPLGRTQRWAKITGEQQTVARRIMDYIEATQGIKRGEKLNISNINILRDDMNKIQKKNKLLQEKDTRYRDIISLMLTFQRKYGANYPNILLELLNAAY